jgi:hypothetical protein
MAAVLAASDFQKDEEEPTDDATMSNVLSQKRLNEPIKDVMARIKAREENKLAQFAQGIHMFGPRKNPYGGYLNPNAVTPIPEEFKAQYEDTQAQIAGTVSSFIPVPGLGAARTILKGYYEYGRDADRRRLTAAAGGPVSAGWNAQYLSDLGVPDQYGADQLSLPNTVRPPTAPIRVVPADSFNEEQAINDAAAVTAARARWKEHQESADLEREEEQAINEALENADTYGGHPADYY